MPLCWPEAARPAAGRCGRCRRERVLELQVMSPIWHFMEEGAEWYDAASASPALELGVSALRAPMWDWLTIAVFVCPAACLPPGDAEWACAEEGTVACHGARVADAGGLPGVRLPSRSAASSSELSGGG